MILEQESLYAQAYALQGDERIAFIRGHNLDDWEFLKFAKALNKGKGKRTKKQQRRAAFIAGRTCPLCEEVFVESDEIRTDHATGKVLHVGCQLYVGRARKMIADGITLDRLADYLQIIPPKPPLDVFGPDAPDADI